MFLMRKRPWYIIKKEYLPAYFFLLAALMGIINLIIDWIECV